MKTYGRIPKTLLAACAKYAGVIDEVGKDDDGYWIWLKPGFIAPEMECGTIHEMTVADAIGVLNTVTWEGSK